MRVVHESRTADEAARLLAVALAVQRVRPPGIVRVVEIDERDDGSVVVITEEAEPGDDGPAVLAAAAAALAALHAQGVAHGGVAEAAHRRDPAGRAVLPLPSWRGDDPAATIDGDIADLCELAGERTARSAHELATRLAPPSPRVLATKRDRTAPPRPGLRLSVRRPKHRRGTTVGALAATAGVVTMGVAVLAPSSTARSTRSTAATTATTTAVPVTVPASADRVLVIGGHRYELGVDGDLVVEGRWACDDSTGSRLPVVVRPATGDVLVFDTIAPDATATPVTRMEGITGAGRATDGVGCDHLLIDTADNPTTEVDVATGRAGGSPPRSPAAVPAP
jgi:hypothetical protein